MANTYIAISTTTVGSGGAGTIQFSSIPSTYTDLLLKVSARTSGAAQTRNMRISFNSDTANYSSIALNGNGSSAFSDTSTNYLVGYVNAASTTASTFANVEIYIPNYTSSNNKSYSVDGVTENNGTEAYAKLNAGLWSNSAAITSITLDATNGAEFQQYSTATLYGIKKN